MNNDYVLLVSDWKNNDIKLVPLSEEDIYGSGSKINKVFNSLEDIDLFTSRFHNEYDLGVYLMRKKGGFSNFDVFIGHKYSYNNKINLLEVLYNKSPYVSYLCNDYLNEEHSSSDMILDKFAEMVDSDDEFYRYLREHNSNVDSGYIFSHRGSLPAKEISGAWVKICYSLLRNIVEAMQTYNGYGNGSACFAAKCSNYEKSKKRGQFSNIISIYLDQDTSSDDYLDRQVRVFCDAERYKIKEIYDTVMNLDSRIFDFNNGFVDVDLSMYGDYVDSLNDLLKKQLYIISIYVSFINSGDTNYKNVLKQSVISLINILKVNLDLLDNLYSFVLVYNRCIDNSRRNSDDLDGNRQKNKSS